MLLHPATKGPRESKFNWGFSLKFYGKNTFNWKDGRNCFFSGEKWVAAKTFTPERGSFLASRECERELYCDRQPPESHPERETIPHCFSIGGWCISYSSSHLTIPLFSSQHSLNLSMFFFSSPVSLHLLQIASVPFYCSSCTLA